MATKAVAPQPQPSTAFTLNRESMEEPNMMDGSQPVHDAELTTADRGNVNESSIL